MAVVNVKKRKAVVKQQKKCGNPDCKQQKVDQVFKGLCRKCYDAKMHKEKHAKQNFF